MRERSAEGAASDFVSGGGERGGEWVASEGVMQSLIVQYLEAVRLRRGELYEETPSRESFRAPSR